MTEFTPDFTASTRRRLAAVTALVLVLVAAGPARATTFDDEQADRLREAIAAFDHEPDVREVQRRVLNHRNIDDERPDRWTRRARLSNLLPRLRGRVRWLDQRDEQQRFREDLETDEEGEDIQRDRTQHRWRDDLRLRYDYSLRVDFRLSELVYSSDEMAIQREIRHRWRTRDEAVERVTDLYYERRRLQLEHELFPEDDPELMLDRLLEIDALTARIDAMTGGWFTRQLDREDRR